MAYGLLEQLIRHANTLFVHSQIICRDSGKIVTIENTFHPTSLLLTERKNRQPVRLICTGCLLFPTVGIAPIAGQIKTLTIQRDAVGNWYACFACKVEPDSLPLNELTVGIDMGLGSFATLSNGIKIENPRFFRRDEGELANAQRKLSKAEKGARERAKRRSQMSAEDFHRAARLSPVIGETLPAGRALSQEEILALLQDSAEDPRVIGTREAAAIAIMLGAGLRRGKDSGPLFLSVNKGGNLIYGRRLIPQAIYHLLQNRAKRAGVKSFTPHDLRRTFVSKLLNAGVDIAIVAKMAGHSNIQTTARYDRRPEEAKQRAAKLLQIPYNEHIAKLRAIKESPAYHWYRVYYF